MKSAHPPEQKQVNMQIEYNPLEALQNERVFGLFARMLAHRYRTDILHEYRYPAAVHVVGNAG